MRTLLSSFLVASCFVSASAQAPVPEQGTFVLHKFAKAIGKETYTVTPGKDGFGATSEFLFADRGTPVPLKTSYVCGVNGCRLELDGKSSRMSALKDVFTLDAQGHTLTREHDGKTDSSPAGEHEFLIDGYSPVMMQQELLRYWLRQGKPGMIATPSGNVRISATEPIKLGAAKLNGYVIHGLIWGGETLWMDDQKQLVALVSTDAEFDHFEAVRESYEPHLADFIAAAAKDQLEDLAKLSTSSNADHTKGLIISNVTLIDGTGEPAAEGADVLIEHGRITKIAHRERMDTKNVVAIDGTGKFLIPGLWDMHAHYEQVEWGPIYLASGVTTVRDCGNEFDFITTVSNTLKSGKGLGPRLLIAGIVDGSGPQSLGAIVADTPEQAIAVVHKYHDAGALQIKIYSSMKPALVPVITAEAHRLGMTVTGHVPNGMTSVEVVNDGYDMINHVQYPLADFLGKLDRTKPMPLVDIGTPENKAKMQVFVDHKTVLDDTVSLFEVLYRPSTIRMEEFEPGIANVAPQLEEALNNPGLAPAMMARVGNLLPDMYAVIAAWHKAGLPVVAGTDQNIPGYSLHREMELYVEKAGFTPMEALQAATIVPARAMKLDGELGTIEVGKRADVVLLDANPLEDIHNTRYVAKVIHDGVAYDPAPLWKSVDFQPAGKAPASATAPKPTPRRPLVETAPAPAASNE